MNYIWVLKCTSYEEKIKQSEIVATNNNNNNNDNNNNNNKRNTKQNPKTSCKAKVVFN